MAVYITLLFCLKNLFFCNVMLRRWVTTLRRVEGTRPRNVTGTAVHEFETPQSLDIFSSPYTFRTTLGLTNPPLQWVLGFLVRLKRPERDIDQTPPYSVEAETEWSYTSASCMFLSSTYETNFPSSWPAQSYVWLAPDFLMPDCNNRPTDTPPEQICVHFIVRISSSYYSMALQPNLGLGLFKLPHLDVSMFCRRSSPVPAFQRVLSLHVHCI